MKSLKYTRSWTSEDVAQVTFVDGREEACHCQTDAKGEINWLFVDEKYRVPHEFPELGISRVDFMTPRRLNVETPTDVLVDVYVRLAEEVPEAIAEGNASGAIKKAQIRSDIAEEVHKRNLNMHELLSERIEQDKGEKQCVA